MEFKIMEFKILTEFKILMEFNNNLSNISKIFNGNLKYEIWILKFQNK